MKHHLTIKPIILDFLLIIMFVNKLNVANFIMNLITLQFKKVFRNNNIINGLIAFKSSLLFSFQTWYSIRSFTLFIKLNLDILLHIKDQFRSTNSQYYKLNLINDCFKI